MRVETFGVSSETSAIAGKDIDRPPRIPTAALAKDSLRETCGCGGVIPAKPATVHGKSAIKIKRVIVSYCILCSCCYRQSLPPLCRILSPTHSIVPTTHSLPKHVLWRPGNRLGQTHRLYRKALLLPPITSRTGTRYVIRYHYHRHLRNKVSGI